MLPLQLGNIVRLYFYLLYLKKKERKKKKKGGQHGRPMTGLSHRAMQAAWLVPRLPCCGFVVCLGGVLFSVWW